MSKSLRDAIAPLLFVFYLCGMGIIEQPISTTKFCLYKIYSFTLWLSYVLAFFYVEYYSCITLKKTAIFLFISQMNLLNMSISFYISFCYNKKLDSCLKKLTLVDETLKHLNVPIDFQKLRKHGMGCIIIVVLTIVTFNSIEATWWVKELNYSYGLLMSLLTNHCLHVNNMVELLFGVFICHIETRFDRLNEYTSNLTFHRQRTLKKEGTINVKSMNTRNTKNIFTKDQKIWTLMQLHLELCKVCRELNKFFGLQLTLQMAFSFIYILAFFFTQYKMLIAKVITPPTFSAYYMWCGLLVGKLIYLNMICERCSNKVTIAELMYKEFQSAYPRLRF